MVRASQPHYPGLAGREQSPRRRTRPTDAGNARGPEAPAPMEYEVEVVPGLEEFAERELRARFGRQVAVGRPVLAGRVPFRYRGDPRRLLWLRVATAVYAVETFAVPRPKALLGHEHLGRILALVDRARRLDPPDAYATFRLSAAGADTPVLARLKDEIAARTGLIPAAGQADLVMAVRRAPDRSDGWQTLVRLGPRPLSARLWRRCNLPGALNATVARVMVELAQPTARERFLNVACGSGTLMIERLQLGPARMVAGNDRDDAALRCARENARASKKLEKVELIRSDLARLPFPDASFDTIVSDLPYGMLMGSARDNERLYPAFLAEATRLASRGAALVAITASTRLFEAALAQRDRQWETRRVIPIQISFQNGYLRPKIYLLRRMDDD